MPTRLRGRARDL
jgi:DnaK suppressor protein